jgi:hypothetical protein
VITNYGVHASCICKDQATANTIAANLQNQLAAPKVNGNVLSGVISVTVIDVPTDTQVNTAL